MSKAINTNFQVNAPKPIDSRLVVANQAALAAIPIVYIGLKTYSIADDADFRYKASGWEMIDYGSGGGGSAVWGAIGGTLTDQTDLVEALDLKFDKTGGTITGAVAVLSEVTAQNVIIWGSGPTAAFPYLTLTNVPATASSTGTVGEGAIDSNYLYVCVGTNTWKRAALTTW